MKVRALLFALLMPLGAAAWAQTPNNVRVRVQGDATVAPGESMAAAVAVMGSVRVEGTLTGDAVAIFGDVVIGPKGSVGGNAISVGGHIRRAAGSRLAGKEVAIESPARNLGKLVAVGIPLLAGAVAFVGALVIVASTVGFAVLVVAVLVLFERNVAAARRVMVVDPFRTFLIGVLVFLAALPIAFFLAATLIGIPLALVVLAVLLAAVCLGAVAVCEWIGEEIARRSRRPLKPVWAGLLGLAVIFVVGTIPWLGSVVHVIVSLLGLGAVFRTRFRAVPEIAEPPAA
jgi:hypothetical protein